MLDILKPYISQVLCGIKLLEKSPTGGYTLSVRSEYVKITSKAVNSAVIPFT